jgi:partner of Y14 and mago
VRECRSPCFLDWPAQRIPSLVHLAPNMSHPPPDSITSSSKSGIKTTADGGSYIPSSKRADGSTRKEIKVRPGYKPPEDVETYKNRNAESWKNRGKGGVPGAEPVSLANDDSVSKSKNAKRREAARRKAAETTTEDLDDEITSAMQKTGISAEEKRTPGLRDAAQSATNEQNQGEADADQQKKIRNQLKKLRAVRELREKRAAGEKLSPDQIMKIGKESELLRDLKKMGYDGPELQDGAAGPGEGDQPAGTSG